MGLKSRNNTGFISNKLTNNTYRYYFDKLTFLSFSKTSALNSGMDSVAFSSFVWIFSINSNRAKFFFKPHTPEYPVKCDHRKRGIFLTT
jgi:hypothetical protein